MRIKRFLSGFLAVTLALSCINWRAASAQNVQTSNTTNSTYATEISDTNLEALTENSQILDHVDSEQFFDAEHIARLPEEETLDSYVFLNRDGSKSIYYVGQPVKYVDSNGVIQEKDTTLIRSNGGYCMRNNDIDLHIPDAVATGITVAYNNQTVKLTPQGGSGSAQQYDNSIVYYDYYGKGTILRYTPMLSGVKEDIILAKYTGQNSFTFLLETNGLQLYEDQGQYYLAENQDVSAAFYLGQIAVYDAIGRPDLGIMTAETIIPGQKYRLTIAANESFLLDPETVYPVTIDPTVTVRDSADVSGTVEDAPVFSGYANRSFGDYVFNNIGYVDGYKLARTAFRLTSLLADSNYNQLSAEQLNSVSFHLKGSGGQFANLSLHALTENATWTESTLTWNNLGAYSETAYTTVRMGSSVWKTFDITALAKDWKTGAQNPDCGFVLISDSTTSSVSTFSAEYSTVDYRPYVVVNYTGTIALSQVSATLSVGGTLALTATTTPTGQVVSWASEDPTVAEVSEDGVVTALSLGTTTITASLEDGTSAECEVTVVAKSISLNYNTSDKIASVYKGETITLIATTEPAGEAVDWVSLNPEIATVANGVVTGISVGTATIKAVLSDGTYAECRVYVLSKDISLNSTDITLYVDDTKRLIATTVPPGEDVEWISLNPDVATVSDNGVVTAVSAGETTIRVYIDDETYAICAVTVKRPTISLNTTRIEIAVGESFLLTANPDPFTSRLYWNSHDSSIASVSSGGNVTGVAPGETYITIRASTGVITFCFVTVIEQQISISGESSVREGESLTLSVTKRPTEWNVIWSSSDPSIATVSQTGEVTGVKAGTVTITATMEDGPSAAYTIYVTIPDGVYYLHFPYEITNYYLQALYLKNNVSNELILHSKASDHDPTTTRIAQMWRITHIGVGQYTIRPINNLDMCLGVNSNIENGYRYVANYCEETDTLEDVPLNAQWTIMWMDDGYALLAYGSTNRALTTYGGIQAQNVSVVVDTYSDVESSFRWTLTPVTRVPTGLALYDKTTGLPADTMPRTYVAPDEMRNLRLLNYEMFFFPDKSLSNTIKYIVGNQNLASINDNGEITGISPGTTNVFVYLHCGDSTEVLEFPLTVTGISNGTYFLRNKTTGYYADIHSQIMENGRTIHQWEPHGGITQSWIFTHLGDGTYTIQSAKYTVNSSTKYYLGVSGDSSTVDQPVVLRTGSITSGMKWVVEPTTDGAFKLIPKSGEAAGCVLATTTSDATNGAILIQGKYIDNNSYRDEWLLCTVCTVYTLSLNIYYDYAFAERHPTAETLLNSFQPQINNILGKVFGICLTWNTPQKIHSTPDYCKLYSGIGIYTNTVNCICPANPSLDVPGCNYYNVNQNKHANNPMSQYFPCKNCTSWYQIYHDFIKDYPGNDLTTSVLFTGSALYDDNGVQCNRSYSWYNNGVLLQNISSSTADYYKDVFSTLVHEISHDIGAIDHYHEILKDDQGNEYCRGGANCYRCNEETGRPMWCIMDQGKITNPTNVDTDNLYCSACLEEIFEHLSSHHTN